MTKYTWTSVKVPDHGHFTFLIELETRKHIQFYTANPLVREEGIASHMNSLTDSLCEQWFDEALTVEERKAKQKARKEQQRKEREELEARVAAQKAEAARLKAEEKAAEKARRQQRS